MSKFLPKKGEFIVAKATSVGNRITKGKVYEVARDTKEHPAKYEESLVDLVKTDDGVAGSAFVRRFEPQPIGTANPQPAVEVAQGRHYEVRAASTQYGAPKAITRKSHLKDAEDFVLRNAELYQGPFEIVEVEVIQRTTVLRKVERKPVTTYKLVDA